MAHLSAVWLRRASPLVAATLALVLLPALARADCGEDIATLMKKRVAQITVLNQNTRAHGGKLDAVTACPQLRNLAAMEGNIVAYMTKNKEWCSLPDDLVAKMSESRNKTSGIAAKACEFAVKIKKMQQQQAAAPPPEQQQALKLPAGPL